MVKESRLLRIHAAEEIAASRRIIAANVCSMDETTMLSRELIAETKALIRRLDRLLKYK